MKSLWLRAAAICLLAALGLGCNTIYHVRVRTFPPAVGDVYVDDEFKGTTSEKGETTINSGKKSIFEGTVLTLRKDDEVGAFLMDFSKEGVRLSHVLSATRQEIGVNRHYEIVFSFAKLPPLPARAGGFEEGRNRVSVRNPNDVAVLISWRREGRGFDYIAWEGQTLSLELPDGDYHMYLIYASAPGEIVELEQTLHLSGSGGSVDLPPPGDSAYVGVWHNEPGSLTYSNYDRHIQLTFPNDMWRVFTRPQNSPVWVGPTPGDSSYHVMVATVPELAILLQVLVQPIRERDASLEDFLTVLTGSMEMVLGMVLGGDLESLHSEVAERGGRRIGVAMHTQNNMQFLSVVIPEEHHFTVLTFNCFEGLFESREDEFWAIVDSYKPVTGAEATSIEQERLTISED